MKKGEKLKKIKGRKKIGENWKTIRRGSKIYVSKNTKVATLSGKRILKKGYYYITGYWADAVGLNKKSAQGQNEYVLPSAKLQDFYMKKNK